MFVIQVKNKVTSNFMKMKSITILISCIVICLSLRAPDVLQAGPYADSAHGNSSAGVKRNTGHLASIEYAIGNCAHCHEQHAIIGGSEPDPVDGLPADFMVFTDNFSGKATNPYSQSDNFCFYCHTNVGGIQSGGGVVNRLYSNTFGCSTASGAMSIIDAFNLRSYHNLNDIKDFATSNFSFFKSYSNPCSACHNPHLARRNCAYPSNPVYSAISKPSDHESLWGTTATMGSVYGNDYEPLYCNSSHTNREPGASSSDSQGRANTPNYVGFCTDCHTPTATIYSANLGRNLRKINWGMGGEKHGVARTDRVIPRNASGVSVPDSGGGAVVQPPYVKVDVSYDYVLSCLDCHEPHGSPNVMLLRSRVNGGELGKTITTMDLSSDDGVIPNDNKEIGYLCQRCHYDDKTGGWFSENETNNWRYIHHASALDWDTPFKNSTGDCNNYSCHSWSGNGFGVVHCLDCHYHGSIYTIVNGGFSGETRKTF